LKQIHKFLNQFSIKEFIEKHLKAKKFFDIGLHTIKK
jgi:hypothetical protein